MAQIKCVVVTPETTSLEEEAKFVVIPLYDGELGVASGHSPMIGRLGYGELRLTSLEGKVSRYYVDGGFAQVTDNTVTILTGRCVAADRLATSEIEESLASAMQRPIDTDELYELRERSIRQARAQLAVAKRA